MVAAGGRWVMEPWLQDEPSLTVPIVGMFFSRLVNVGSDSW